MAEIKKASHFWEAFFVRVIGLARSLFRVFRHLSNFNKNPNKLNKYKALQLTL